MSRNIYVKDRDVDLWRRAEEYATERRLSMSALLMNALDAYLPEPDTPDK